MASRKPLRTRWTTEQTDAAVLYILGETEEVPFDFTPEGMIDLRGLAVKGFFRPEGIALNNIDLSYSHVAHGLIFANSHIANVNCDCLEGNWGDFCSDFTNVTFRSAKMKGSSFGGGGSRYFSCDFDQADISGSNGFEAAFVECSFRSTRFSNSIMGGCCFKSCQFKGSIERTIFGNSGTPVFEDCDFKEASFVNCTFNNTRFRNCRSAKDTLIFHNWVDALDNFEVKVADLTDETIKKDCDLWIRVWKSRLDITPENLIDLADLQKQMSSTSAKWIFDVFSEIHSL